MVYNVDVGDVELSYPMYKLRVEYERVLLTHLFKSSLIGFTLQTVVMSCVVMFIVLLYVVELFTYYLYEIVFPINR